MFLGQGSVSVECGPWGTTLWSKGEKRGTLRQEFIAYSVRGRTHVWIKGQNLNFYLETHATPHNIHATPHDIYFKWLRMLPRILACGWLVDDSLSGVYTSNLLNDLEFYLGQILSLYEAKYLGQIFSQTFCFIEGIYLAQTKFQIV